MRRDTFDFFRKSVLSFQKKANQLVFLEIIERRFVKNYAKNSGHKKIGPLFIIGAPRTGSTLLFQLLLNCYHFSYISNIASFFYRCPSTATLLTQKVFGRYRNKNWKSEYGYVSGLTAPSEAGPLMKHWFGRDLTRINVSETNIDFVVQSLSAISHVMAGPCLFKNLRLSLKIEGLSKIFPEAIFVNLRREPIYVAQSIIETRRKLVRSDREWWSYEVPNKAELMKLDPFEQVAFQIKTIWDFVEEAEKKIGPSRFIELNYEDLCQSTKDTLGRVKERCSENGLFLKERESIAFQFKKSEERQLSESEWSRLDSIISRVF